MWPCVVDVIKSKCLWTALSNSTLVQLIQFTQKDIERLKTENYFYERTIERLEEPDKLVEEMFASKKGDGDEDSSIPLNTATTICASDESESEIPAAEDGEPDYSPIIPIDEINVSTDSFFDNMSDNSKDVALNYFRNIGIIAPPHYDVMRHKYGDLVKGAEEDPAYTLKAGAGVAVSDKRSIVFYFY